MPFFVIRDAATHNMKIVESASLGSLDEQFLATKQYFLDWQDGFASWQDAERYVMTGVVAAPAKRGAPTTAVLERAPLPGLSVMETPVAVPAQIPARAPEDLEAFLLQHFNIPRFRGSQRETIEAVLAGRDTMAVMPTGTGKSICYQLPALLAPGLTLVVSPLKALMKDQVDSLKARGIAATMINSDLDLAEARARVAAMRRGEYRLVFIAPERFRNASFRTAIGGLEISLFAVDEAHCVSEWGHQFRPDYLLLKEAIAACHHPTVLAVTATATQAVRNDIALQLGLRDPAIFIGGFERPNLSFEVGYIGDPRDKATEVERLITQTQGPAIVYVATRRTAETVAARLAAKGVAAAFYHGEMKNREKTQESFMKGELRVIVATNAFGMGVDKADVRLVIHIDIPRSIEAYYQEAGRAGRDGLPAACLLLYADQDEPRMRQWIESDFPQPHLMRLIYALLLRQPEHRSVAIAKIQATLAAGNTPEAYLSAANALAARGLIEKGSTAEGEPAYRVREITDTPYSAADEARDDARKAKELARLDVVVAYAGPGLCRRNKILQYFGVDIREACGACDLCKFKREATEQSALYTAQQALPKRVACPYCKDQVAREQLRFHCRSLHKRDLPDGFWTR